MRSVSGAGFSFDWTANPGTSLSFASFYPGDDVVDIVGLDIFDMKWQDTTSSPEQRWSFLLNQFNGLIAHRDFAAQHGKPLSFPEWGLYAKGDVQGGGGDNPYYIDRMADWFANNNVAYTPTSPGGRATSPASRMARPATGQGSRPLLRPSPPSPLNRRPRRPGSAHGSGAARAAPQPPRGGGPAARRSGGHRSEQGLGLWPCGRSLAGAQGQRPAARPPAGALLCHPPARYGLRRL